MKRIYIAGVSAGAILLLAACSSTKNNDHNAAGSQSAMSSGMSMPGGSDASASGPHNAGDVSFATGMIPHHGQAVTMADMALMKASSAEVKQLATAIKRAQDPEIQMMSGWLTGWGEAVPSTTMAPMPGMSHPGMTGMSPPGMMSDKEMAALDKATGAAFDRMWVTMMISHHTGAVTMAKTELDNGQNVVARALARSIIGSQSAEIATMRTLLSKLPS